jgi:gliding motility-associated-like protein
MKKIPTYLRGLSYTVVLLLSGLVAHANHLVGMDFFYRHVSGNTYKIFLVAYGDCGSALTSIAFSRLPINTPTVFIYNGNTFVDSLDLTVEAPSAGVEITPVCPADISLTQCTDLSYTIPGIKKFVYSVTYTLPGTSPVWRFLFTGDLNAGTLAGRSVSITNISSSPDTYIQLLDTLNNTVTPNTSPTLTNVPTPFFCLDNNDNYNPGAVDPDGDSLKFFLVPGQSGTTTRLVGGLVTYIVPFTATAPLAVTTMTFDQQTGQIAFHPNALQRALVVYNIEEFHGGAFKGTSQREMTFLVQTCTNTPPTGSLTGATNGVIDDATHFHICQNSGPFSIHIDPTESDTLNNITVTTSGLPTGCTFTTVANGTPHPHCTISWTSTGVTPGTYTFYVTFTDNNCPLSGTQTLAFTIRIVSSPTVSASIVSAAACEKRAAVLITPGGGGSPWTVKVSQPGDTIQTITGVSTSFIDSIPPGTYTITVISVGTGCRASTTVTITLPPPVSIGPTFTNPSYCGANDGTIKLHHLRPGTVDTIKFYYGGILQPVRILTVAFDSTVTLTGLLAGVYTNITAAYGYCVSLPAGPVTLVNPAFTMRSLTSTNPIFCGICNGTITLHGLHPGQLDTVSYTLGGIFQPPVISFIGIDSTVTITGLCAGVYGNFVAKTAGVCVSNTLGPVTLTVPPFTMRALSHTNPDYCGICNGTVTLYGLHPGGFDTITYTRSGLFQPPVPVFVGPDSTVTITGLCAGSYDNFVAHAGAPCVSNALGPVTLTVPPFTIRALGFTNPDYCGICNGTITIYGAHPGMTDTVSYTLGGVPQTPYVQFVGPDSTITITGLCAGTYSNFIARTGGICVSNSLGPVTLTVPPFTMRSLSHTNPDYCGICNGSITLYGLHPGQTDTVSFTYGGVAAPPVIRLIGADSTVTITGLCAGTYDNFIARTGGICISNSLGPVDLVVPPFTMRDIGFKNPTKCGFCDGVIRLYGLHPGQLDTITYNFNGVPQPPISYLIGLDSIVIISRLCEGVYSNFVAHTGGVCVSNVLGPVTLKAPPIIPAFIYEIHEGCGGDTLICTNQSWPASDLTYTWKFGDGGTSTAVNPVHIYTAPGSFDIKLIITNTKCFDSVVHTIKLDNLIVAGFNSIPDSFACQGRPVSFNNTSLGTLLTYKWYFGDGGTDNVTDPVHTYKNTGTYNVILAVTNYVPCFDTAVAVFTVDSNSTISMLATDSVLCGGTSITLTGIYAMQGLRGLTWAFGNGDSIKNVNPVLHVYEHPGDYIITLKAIYRACPDTSVSRIFRVYGLPGVSLGADTSICPGSEAIKITDNQNAGNKAARWLWNTGERTPGITVVAPGDYYVTVTVDGCTSTDTITVFKDCYMNIPNVFTPNGDGMNDYFFPREMLTRGLTSFSLEIFNRWGQLIFATTSLDGRGWDGRFNDVAQPEGVFVYKIDATFKDGQKEHHVGNVTLLR